MEDALVLKQIKLLESLAKGLNPCFNGRCTRTLYCGDTSDYEQRRS